MASVTTQNPISLSFVQGTTPRYVIVVKQDNVNRVDLTDCTISGDIRLEYTTDVVASWDATITDPTNGVFELSLTKEATASLPVTGFRTSFVFDVDIEFPNGDVKTWIYGYLKVTREVTR